MINSVDIKNFQSLQDVSVDLAPFTVVVGPSSSGKSAFIRALSTLVSNRRGTDFISHGTTTSVITADTDKGKVSLSRSITASKNKYTIIPTGGDPVSFTKLGGDTPSEISDFLGLYPKDPVTLALQFDKPFLLADSPGQAAQTLGSLTNVHVIFDAAREANRQRLASSQTLKTRQSDLEGVQEKLAGFEDLQDQLDSLDTAEQALARATTAEKRIAELNVHIDTLRSTKYAIAAATEVLEKELPSDARIVEAASRVASLETTVSGLREANRQGRDAEASLQALDAEIEALEAEYTSTLVALGTCPTCMQEVKVA